VAEVKKGPFIDGWVFVLKQLIIPLILTSIIGLTGYLMALDRKTTALEVEMKNALNQIATTCKAMERIQENLVNVYTEQTLSSSGLGACRELAKQNAMAIDKLIQMHLHE
jgi:flavoprotein